VASTTVRITASAARGKLNVRGGELVEVRSEEEILATLDVSGELDLLPFMPETLQRYDKRFTVYKVAHNLCDTMTRTGMRRMRDAVHQRGCVATGKRTAVARPAASSTGRRPGLRRRTGLPTERTRRRRAGSPLD
jgi:hypothetical protein